MPTSSVAPPTLGQLYTGTGAGTATWQDPKVTPSVNAGYAANADSSSVALALKTATTSVAVSSAAAPNPGDVLTAINGTSAHWAPGGGGGGGGGIQPGDPPSAAQRANVADQINATLTPVPNDGWHYAWGADVGTTTQKWTRVPSVVAKTDEGGTGIGSQAVGVIPRYNGPGNPMVALTGSNIGDVLAWNGTVFQAQSVPPQPTNVINWLVGSTATNSVTPNQFSNLLGTQASLNGGMPFSTFQRFPAGGDTSSAVYVKAYRMGGFTMLLIMGFQWTVSAGDTYNDIMMQTPIPAEWAPMSLLTSDIQGAMTWPPMFLQEQPFFDLLPWIDTSNRLHLSMLDKDEQRIKNFPAGTFNTNRFVIIYPSYTYVPPGP